MKAEENLATRKREIHQLIDSVEDQSLLDQIYVLLNNPGDVWWDEEAEREAIEAADADIASGRILTHEQVMQNIRECLKR